MKKKFYLCLLLLLLLVPVLVLTSCGDDPGTGGGGGGDKTYTVTFEFGNVKSVPKTLKEGELPTEKLIAKDIPRGYTVVMWDKDFLPVDGDTTYKAVITTEERVGARVLKAAIEADLMPGHVLVIYTEQEKQADPELKDKMNFQNDVVGSTALYTLCLEEYSDPQDGVVADRIVEHLKNICYDGNESCIESWPAWGSVMLTAAFTLAVNTETVTDRFVGELTDMKDRLDCLMRTYAVHNSFASADWNDYRTGPGLVGNYSKGWNPNYRLANALPIVNAVEYFGSAEAVNEILYNFKYDDYIADFEKYGFDILKLDWTGMGRYEDYVRDLMEKGGVVEEKNDYLYPDTSGGGDGKGVIPPQGYDGFTYSGTGSPKTLDDYLGIADDLLLYTFSGGTVKAGLDSGRAYTLNYRFDSKTGTYTLIRGKENPMLGRQGELLEMAEESRSSYGYSVEDFVMAVVEMSFLEVMGGWSRSTHDVYDFAAVGLNDLLYKGRMGYHSLNQHGESNESDNPSQLSMVCARSIWLHYFDDTMIDFYDASKDLF